MMEWQALSDGALDSHPFKLSFPLCGNGLSKPLDSGLRRAAKGVLPSRRIQDILGGLFQTPLYHLHPRRRVHK